MLRLFLSIVITSVFLAGIAAANFVSAGMSVRGAFSSLGSVGSPMGESDGSSSDKSSKEADPSETEERSVDSGEDDVGHLVDVKISKLYLVVSKAIFYSENFQSFIQKLELRPPRSSLI